MDGTANLSFITIIGARNSHRCAGRSTAAQECQEFYYPVIEKRRDLSPSHLTWDDACLALPRPEYSFHYQWKDSVYVSPTISGASRTALKGTWFTFPAISLISVSAPSPTSGHSSN